MAKQAIKTVIGKTDKVDFPGLGLCDISCKVDTGADTSAIHCHRVHLVERDDEPLIRFQLLDPAHPLYDEKEFEVTDFSQKTIKNSFGLSEDRFVIHSQIFIFGRLLDIDLTLADREHMAYPVLLGRRFLMQNRLVVDVAKNQLSYKLKSKIKQGDKRCESPSSPVARIYIRRSVSKKK